MSFQTLEAVGARTAVVRVNLLPSYFEDARKARRLKIGLGIALLGVVGFAGAGYVVTLGHVSDANDALAAAQAQTARLQAEQAPYAEVPQILAEVEAAESVSQTVASTNVPWYAYVNDLAAGAPADLSMTSVQFTVGVAASASGAAAPTTTVDGESVIGTLSVTGETKAQTKVADWMDQIGTIKGLADPALADSSLAVDTGVVTFNATASVTDQALLSNH